jgi:hypothetical protein
VANGAAILAWQPRTFVFTADDARAKLQFRCLQNANLHFAFIDGVARIQVTPAATTTWGRLKRPYAH